MELSTRRERRRTITRGRGCIERLSGLLDDLLLQCDLPAGHPVSQPDLALADKCHAAIENEVAELRERLDALVGAYRQAAEAPAETKAA